jgi:hypothetical protein
MKRSSSSTDSRCFEREDVWRWAFTFHIGKLTLVTKNSWWSSPCSQLLTQRLDDSSFLSSDNPLFRKFIQIKF